MLEVQNLCFSYQSHLPDTTRVLNHLSFKIEAGSFLSVIGPSGSGKSTLFYILGLMLKPTSGNVLFQEQNITTLSDLECAFLRNQKIGFVFQNFHLLSKLTVLDNILLPVVLSGQKITPQWVKKATDLADFLKIYDLLRRLPKELSGGQSQRTTLARALILDPDLILADEPTGNLDPYHADLVMRYFKELHARGKTICLITHDQTIASQTQLTLKLHKGSLTQVQTQNPKGYKQLTQKHLITPMMVFQKIHWKAIKANIFYDKLKLFLMTFSIMTGVAALFFMISLNTFGMKQIMEHFESMGVNKLTVRTDSIPTHATSLRPGQVIFDHLDIEKDILGLKKRYPEDIKFISPVWSVYSNKITFQGSAVQTPHTVLGVGSEYLKISNDYLLTGIAFDEIHVQNSSPVCILGFEIAKKLFNHQRPLDQAITISNGDLYQLTCRVIGVLKPKKKGSADHNPNLRILLPHTTFSSIPDVFTNMSLFMRLFILQLNSFKQIPDYIKIIKNQYKHHYGPSIQITLDNDVEVLQKIQKIMSLLQIFFLTAPAIVLAVASMGLNNMMLASISERLREFGLKKALGASNQSIFTEVLLESCIISLISGCIGIFVGFILFEICIFFGSQLISEVIFGWSFDLVAMCIALISIICLGILSGIIPALKVKKLEIIKALREE
jgi:macrolide transport system ATP-binding/permease protein